MILKIENNKQKRAGGIPDEDLACFHLSITTWIICKNNTVKY